METKTVRALFERQVEAFTGSPEFAALEAGCGDYDAFIENVARAHLKSPQLVAFLYALAPPAAARDLLGNLLEELGLEAESERPHPALLEDLLRAAGLGHRLVEVEARAADDVRRIVTEPLLYSALREVGLAALTEIVAFEFMLSRVSGRMARALATHRGLAAPALEWLTHHSEVDVRHAEQGLADLGAYAAYYEFTDDEALTIVEMTLRENVFTRRYFRDATGEGTPRPYVTGETVETMLEHLGRDLWPRVAGRDLPPSGHLAGLATFLPETYLAGALAPNAARAALELAMLDCALRRGGRPMASVLPPRRTRVTYSGVVTAGSVERAVQHARRMRAIGMRHVKVKVGFDDDVARVTAVREALGPGVTLRLDANGAWTFERAVAVLDAVAPLGIAAVEQPLPRGPVDDLARLRQATPVPVMVDESLVTEADADALIEAKAADFFNVRISKCGGLARSLAIAARGSAVGVGVQVGSQVGETAILSAAGRHLAAALPEVTFVEGSFGTLLLAEDVSVESVRFGHRGEAPLLTGPGLGIRVVEERLRRRAITVRELSTEG